MLYENEKGRDVLNSIRKAVDDYGMQDLIKQGVILGLSGGADSVMLLYALFELKKFYGEFNIKCVHVNHMIRGIDADKDETFCSELCKRLGVPLVTHRVDIPKIAKEMSTGIEETARNVRYNILEEEADLLSNNTSIAVAHNATDNLETIIFNMMRGTGINGLAGIKPIRGRIIRPLIYLSKESITDTLDSLGIDYVTDKTNFDVDYSRNYIRNDILPLLKRLSPSPEESATRVSKNLRDDISYIDSNADEFFKENYVGDSISTENIKGLPKAIFSRVLMNMIRQKTNVMPERVHIEKICSLLQGKDFEYSLPGNVKFVSRCGYSRIENHGNTDNDITLDCKLSLGVNVIPGFDDVIILSDAPIGENYSKVYNIEISTTLPSDIIIDGLYVREKQDGDSYSYGGMTHKLKKLFLDRKIPSDKRRLIPVICDNQGIVWVPGFGVRNEGDGVKRSYIAIAKNKSKDNSGLSFYITQRK